MRRTRIDLPSIFRLAELADYIIPFTIRAICELSIADHLAEGPRPVAELAAATKSHERALHRALRALACKGIFTEIEPGVFGLTPMAEFLRSDHPLSLRGAYPLQRSDIRAWAFFDHSLETGEPAFDHVHGQSYWDYMSRNPEESRRLDGAQQAQTRLELRTLLRAYEWADLSTICDVGGGNGAFIAGLLARFSRQSGMLLDLPHVVAGAAQVLARTGVTNRCEIIGGSFLDAVPSGADAYILKRVLYGWSDKQAGVLLRNVRAAMAPSSKILVIEPLVGWDDNTELGARYDLMMLALSGTRARSREELENLFQEAGLRMSRVIKTMMFPIIEGQIA